MRISALDEMKDADVVVVTAETLMQTAPKSISKIHLKVNDDIEQQSVIMKLVAFGYSRVDALSSKGTFVLRGDVLDVYPINATDPVRIDFFGDYIETIKRGINHLRFQFLALPLFQKRSHLFSGVSLLHLVKLKRSKNF